MYRQYPTKHVFPIVFYISKTRKSGFRVKGQITAAAINRGGGAVPAPVPTMAARYRLPVPSSGTVVRREVLIGISKVNLTGSSDQMMSSGAIDGSSSKTGSANRFCHFRFKGYDVMGVFQGGKGQPTPGHIGQHRQPAAQKTTLYTTVVV